MTQTDTLRCSIKWAYEANQQRTRPIYGPVPEPNEENPNPQAPIIGEEPNPNSIIPVDAVEITPEQFDEMFNNFGLRKLVQGKVVTAPIRPPVFDIPMQPRRSARCRQPSKHSSPNCRPSGDLTQEWRLSEPTHSITAIRSSMLLPVCKACHPTQSTTFGGRQHYSKTAAMRGLAL